MGFRVLGVLGLGVSGLGYSWDRLPFTRGPSNLTPHVRIYLCVYVYNEILTNIPGKP